MTADAARPPIPGPGDTVVRSVVLADADAVARIYNHYVAHTHVTFEEDQVTAREMARRIQGVCDADLPWLVAERDGRLLGYAYASTWRPRRAYRFSVEATAYVDPAFARQSIGSRLYGALLPALAARRLHVVVAAIALPNDASIRLHERFGFTKVAHFEEVGFKFGRWIDVGDPGGESCAADLCAPFRPIRRRKPMKSPCAMASTSARPIAARPQQLRDAREVCDRSRSAAVCSRPKAPSRSLPMPTCRALPASWQM